MKYNDHEVDLILEELSSAQTKRTYSGSDDDVDLLVDYILNEKISDKNPPVAENKRNVIKAQTDVAEAKKEASKSAPSSHKGLDDAHAFFDELKRKSAVKKAQSKTTKQLEERVKDGKNNTAVINDSERLLKYAEKKTSADARENPAPVADDRTRVIPNSTSDRVGNNEDEGLNERTVILNVSKPYNKKSTEITGQIMMEGFEVSQESGKTDKQQEKTELWERELSEKRRRKADSFKLENTPTEEMEQNEHNPSYEEIEPDEYKDRNDIPAVRMDLILRSRSVMTRIFITAAIFVLLLIIVFADELHIDTLSYAASPLIHTCVSTGLLLVASFVNFSCVFGGFWSGIRGRADLDTPAAFATVFSILHGVITFVTGFPVSSGLFSACAVLCILTGLFGKYSMVKRISENFELLCTEGEKYCVSRIVNPDVAFELSRGLALGGSGVCFDKKADVPERFLEESFAEDDVDIRAQKLSWLAPIMGLAAAVVTVFVSNASTAETIYNAATAFCGALLLCTPFTSVLSVNLFLRRKCRALRGQGAVVSSAPSAKDFSDVQVISVDAEELFPEGTVQLVNIKSCGTIPIDRVLIDAAGVCMQAGGPLVNVFKSILGGNTDMLPEVDTLIFEEKMGLSGWVSGRRVLIGNRELMDYHGIWVPDADIIRRYESEGIYTVFLADSGMLSAIFFLKYTADEDLKAALYEAEARGLGISVYSVDPNVNEKMICRIFGLSEHSVRVMSPSARLGYKKSLGSQNDTKCASLVHVFDVGSFASGIIGCREITGRVKFFGVLQVIMILSGLILGGVSLGMSGVFGLAASGVLGFQAVWLVLVLLFDVLL